MPSQVEQQGQTGGVGPVQVVQEQNEWVHLGQGVHEPSCRPEDLQLCLVGFHPTRRAELGHDARQLGPARSRFSLKLGRRVGKCGAEELGEGKEPHSRVLSEATPNK